MASKHAKKVKYEQTRCNNEELRIVLLGKTGDGKSATANSILGKQRFESEVSCSPLTVCCDKADGEVDGQKIVVIDTPGLFDTSNDEKKMKQHIKECLSRAAPGPHVFLIIIRLGIFKDEDKKVVQKIQEIFGEASHKFSMVLFTHGDLLKEKTIKQFLDECKDLQELVAKCNDKYHVLNNNLEDCSQVEELLNKIRDITEKNRGKHYNNKMFKAAERENEEEKQRLPEEQNSPLKKGKRKRK